MDAGEPLVTTATKFNPHKIRSLVGSPDLVQLQRGRLVDIATKLFLANGFHATSTRDIAREAGVSAGAIYQYIKTKEDLLALIFHSLLELHESKLFPLMDDNNQGGARLWDAIDIYYRTLDANHDKAHVLYFALHSVSKPLRVHFRQTQERIFSGFERILSEGAATGEFAPCNAPFIAQNIAAMGQAWALRPDRFRGMQIDDYIEAEIISVKALVEPAQRSARRPRSS